MEHEVSERIALEEARTPGYPVVKRTALGQTFNGAIVKAESRDRLKRNEDKTMVPIVKPNGKHAQEMVVTCVTLPGTTAPAGLGDTESIPEPGDLVRLILKGKSFGDWIESKKSMPDNRIAVGDIVIQKTTTAQAYDANGNATGAEITDQATIDSIRAKGRTIGVYGPVTLRLPKDGSDWTTKAVAAYHNAERAGASAETSAATDAGVPDDDEPPF